jgi:hypothetical protein
MKKICLVKGCGAEVYAKQVCLNHYQHIRKGKTFELRGEPLKPPTIAPDKKRCLVRLRDGSRCIRSIKAGGMCSAHHKEAEDRRAFELREQPIDAVGAGFNGNEDELARMCAQQGENQ